MSLKNVTIHWKNNFPTCSAVVRSTNSMVNIYYGVLTAHINHSFIFIVLPHSFKRKAVKRHFRLIFQTLTCETWPKNATYSWLFSCTATISTLTNGSQCEAQIKPTQNCRKKHFSLLRLAHSSQMKGATQQECECWLSSWRRDLVYKMVSHKTMSKIYLWHLGMLTVSNTGAPQTASEGP